LQDATVETIKNGKFDAVFIAIGAAIKKLDVPGIISR